MIPSLLTIGACNNIFDWTVDDSSFDALLADGHQAIRVSDYETAEAKFRAATELRPNHSEARYFLAKAAVLNSDVDVFQLVQTLTDGGGNGATEIFDYEIPIANALYQTNAVVLDALQPIRDGEATEGSFVDANVDLDLGVAFTLRGVLRLRDTNGDGVIDGDDLDPSVFGLGNDGDGDYTLDGIDDIPPDDLNDMIDDLNDLLDEGGDVLSDALGDSGVDIEDLNDLIDSLGGNLSAFYVNTGVPGNSGEGDNDGDGLVDEECLNGIDDDGDGLVDEDSRLLGCSGL
ncbi:MAG: hypothetical protein KC591_14250 [Gemmatimonadetes bacterium]|nr:hypothetical protein [Gemmatimonadota bacterium]